MIYILIISILVLFTTPHILQTNKNRKLGQSNSFCAGAGYGSNLCVGFGIFGGGSKPIILNSSKIKLSNEEKKEIITNYSHKLE